MYQNKYPKMIISIGIYSINRPEAGYGRGGCIYIYIYISISLSLYNLVFEAKLLKSKAVREALKAWSPPCWAPGARRGSTSADPATTSKICPDNNGRIGSIIRQYVIQYFEGNRDYSPQIMDPILPVLSILGYWAILLGTGFPSMHSWYHQQRP